MTWDNSDYRTDVPVRPQAPVPGYPRSYYLRSLNAGQQRLLFLLTERKAPLHSIVLYHSYLFLEDAALEFLNPVSKLGQAGEPGILFLEFVQRPGGSAPNELPTSYRLPGRVARLCPNDGTIFDLAVIGNSHLTANGNIFPDQA